MLEKVRHRLQITSKPQNPMKKLISISIISLILFSAYAQEEYFNSANFGKELSGMILTKDGRVVTIGITYDHPVFLKSPTAPLNTANGAMSKLDIEAFRIDGRTWVFRQTALGPMWVVLERQGAIEVYTTVNSDSKGKNPLIITGGALVKGEERLQQSEIVLGYKKKMTPLVEDNPELAAKIGTKGYGVMQYY